MYLRYRASYFNEAMQTVELGFFKAAVYLSEHAPLTTEDRKQLDQLIHFFDHQLPIPDYYQSKKTDKPPNQPPHGLKTAHRHSFAP